MFKVFFYFTRLSLLGFFLIFHRPAGQPQKLILELSRRQPVFPTDPQFAGLRHFTGYLAVSGWELELQLQPLPRIRMALMHAAKKGATLLVFPTVFNGYNKKDLDILESFVKKGGHLAWVTEHDNFFQHAEAANRFLMTFGVQVKDTALKKGGTNAVDAGWLNARWIKNPEKNVRVYLPACLAVNPKRELRMDTLLVWPPSGDYTTYLLALRVHRKGDKGVVSVLTDFEIFWNMAGTEGFSYGDNRDFLRNFLLAPTQRLYSTKKFTSKPHTKSQLIFQVTQEDSLILRALYGSLLRKRPWRQIQWTTQPSSHKLTTASLSTGSALSGNCHYCLCGPNTRFLQAMAAHAAELEKRYPGISMAPRLKQLYEKFGLSSSPQDSVEGLPYILTQVHVNRPEIRLEGFPQSVPYVGALIAGKASKPDIQLSALAFLRRYGAPLLPDINALQDSSGLVRPHDVLVAGSQERNYFNGLGLWLANQTGSLAPWVHRLRRSSWQNLKNWYSLCLE